MEAKLFVGNLAFGVKEKDLVELFSPFGVVVDTKIMMDRETGRPRGFAFLTMNTKESADAATAALDGKELQGRPLKVNEARPREERPPGKGGFGPRRDSGRDSGRR